MICMLMYKLYSIECYMTLCYLTMLNISLTAMQHLYNSTYCTIIEYTNKLCLVI